jgi:hypothetical protein
MSDPRLEDAGELVGGGDPPRTKWRQNRCDNSRPDASMRRELLALHLPNPERMKANLRSLAEQSLGLSGGGILNICLNAIHAGSRDPDPAKWLVTEDLLLREVKRAKAVNNVQLRHLSDMAFVLVPPASSRICKRSAVRGWVELSESINLVL